MSVAGVNVLFAIWMIVTVVEGVMTAVGVWVREGSSVGETGGVEFAIVAFAIISVVGTGVATVVTTVVSTVGATVVTTVVGAVVTCAGFACCVHPLAATRTMNKRTKPIQYFMDSKLNSPSN
jgi:hypothetical protein